LKYQVLCEQTAFVGVVKQKDKASGEMKEFAVEFGKSIKQAVEQPIANN
jgi:hypothetical protein